MHKKAQVLSILKEFDLDLSDHIDVDAAVKLEPSDGLAVFRCAQLELHYRFVEILCQIPHLRCPRAVLLFVKAVERYYHTPYSSRSRI